MGGRGSGSGSGINAIRKLATTYSNEGFNNFIRENKDLIKENNLWDFDTLKALWYEARNANSLKNPHELSYDTAEQIVADNIPSTYLSGWLRNADSGFKEKLEAYIIGSPIVRNAMLNIAWENYKVKTGESPTFKDFLNKEIPLYRGGNFNMVEEDKFVAYSIDRHIADAFASTKNNVREIKIKVKDTYGSFRSVGEVEVLVPIKRLKEGKDYAKKSSK